MFRVAVLTALVAGALATNYISRFGYPYYGLEGVLLPREVSPALSLLSFRYPGITPATAAQIINSSVLEPPEAALKQINMTVPGFIPGSRIQYLYRLLRSLPVEPFYGPYISPLISQLNHSGLPLGYNDLINPLSLLDYYSGIRGYSPLSSAPFNRFFMERILDRNETTDANVTLALPPLQRLVSRINGIQFANLSNIFGPLRDTTPDNVTFTGPGSALLPLYSSLGLGSPLYPSVTLGGLNSYLNLHRVPFGRFASFFRQAPLSSTINSLPYSSIVSRISSRVPFLSTNLLRNDFAPLLSARYHAYPQRVRNSMYIGRGLATFPRLFNGYFGSRFLPASRIYSTGFFSGALSGFDSYVSSLLQRRYKSFRGPYWVSSLYG